MEKLNANIVDLKARAQRLEDALQSQFSILMLVEEIGGVLCSRLISDKIQDNIFANEDASIKNKSKIKLDDN